MRRALLLTALLLQAPASAEAAFEDLGAGARAPGMGNAFTAVADDVYAIHYNPAGLGTLERPELGLTYTRFYMGLSDNSSLGQSDLVYAQPLKRGRWGAMGLAWNEFKLDTLYTERSLGLSYGKLVLDKPRWGSLFAGLSFKNLNRSFSPGSEADNACDHGNCTFGTDPILKGAHGHSAMDADVGFLWRTPRRYSFALAVKNANQPDVGFGSAADKLPMRVKLAMSYKSLWMNLSGEVISQKSPAGTSDKDAVVAAERFFPSLERGELGVRGSLGVGSRDFKQVTLGLSYKINKIEADYAFLMPLGGIQGTFGTHRLGLSFHFGALSAEEEYSRDLLSQMQRLKERAQQGKGYEFGDISKPAGLDRPELRVIREKIAAGEFLVAHQKLLSLMNELPPDEALVHLAKRLDIVAAYFPDILRPAENWEIHVASASRAFIYGQDRSALLHASYAASLAPKLLKLDKYLKRLEESTQIEADRAQKNRTLVEDKHIRTQEAFDAKDYQTALNESRDVLELEPDDVRALKRIGTSLFLLGYYTEAIASWESALSRETSPNERVALEHYLAKAREAMAEGKQPAQPLAPRKVKRVAPPPPEEQRAQADPRLIERLYQKGMEHYARGEMVLSVAAFQRILALDPGNVPAKKALERIKRAGQ